MKGPGRRGLGGGGRGRRAVTRKRVSEVGRMAENQGLPTRGGSGGGVWMRQHQPCPGEAARWPRASDINALLFQGGCGRPELLGILPKVTDS